MSTWQFNVPPIYEDLQPKYEAKETLESHLLLVHVPDGFAREHIGAKVEFDYGRVRIFGERPLGNNRFSRFNLVYHVPATCDLNVKGKFAEGIVTITMPKKVISKEVPKEEPKPTTEQEAPMPPTHETEPYPEMAQEGIPQKSTTGAEQEETTAAEVKDQKGQEGISDQDTKSTVEGEKQADEALTPPKATDESMPQKGQEGISDQVNKSTVEGEMQADETLTPPKATDESMPEKGQEGISDQDTKSTVEGEKHADETLTPPKATDESLSQKGQEGIPQKATSTADAKHQTEEKLAGTTDENGEKERVGKKETNEDSGKTSESGKPLEKVVVDDLTTEKERKEERKESAKGVKSFVPKTTEKEKEKEINGKFGDADEGIKRKDITESKGKRIKEMAASAPQAVTSLAKRFSEEDNQKLIYMGVAVVVVALGVYASYKFRSRP